MTACTGPERADVFDQIREACQRVVEAARFVHFEERQLDSLAGELLAAPHPEPDLDPAHHRRATPEATLAYVLTLDAVNFGSGWFPFLRKRPGRSGYFTLALCLAEHFDARGPWSARQLREIEAKELFRVFGQDRPGPDVAELLRLYAQALHQLGTFLLDRYAGDFGGPLEEAGGSAALLVEVLASMPFYRDVAAYDGLEVPFYKRAQITVADLFHAFAGRGPGRFHDLDRLTIFADNLVSHVLRLAGVLVYDADLLERIEAGELIPAGALEEVEIRAGAVHAGERLLQRMHERGERLTARELDTLLWVRGQRPASKAHPRHRTRTVYY